MTPLQVTSKPRCKERVKNQWYHVGIVQCDGGTHQCPFPQWKNGYCKRHHPRNILDALRRKEKRLADQLALVRRKIVEAEASPIPPDLSSPENPS